MPTLGRTRPNRAPANEVGNELRHNCVKELTACRQPHVGNIQQKCARNMQALVNAEATINERVIDKAFPADVGAGFLEIDAHDDQKLIGEAVCLGLEPGGVIPGRISVMNGAGTCHNDQAITFSAQAIRRCAAGRCHGFRSHIRNRQLLHQDGRRHQGL